MFTKIFKIPSLSFNKSDHSEPIRVRYLVFSLVIPSSFLQVKFCFWKCKFVFPFWKVALLGHQVFSQVSKSELAPHVGRHLWDLEPGKKKKSVSHAHWTCVKEGSSAWKRKKKNTEFLINQNLQHLKRLPTGKYMKEKLNGCQTNLHLQNQNLICKSEDGMTSENTRWRSCHGLPPWLGQIDCYCWKKGREIWICPWPCHKICILP